MQFEISGKKYYLKNIYNSKSIRQDIEERNCELSGRRSRINGEKGSRR